MAKSRFTYDQFQKAAQSSGLLGQFSHADLSMAQQNPDFGMGILKYKQDFKNATTDEARALANRGAEDLRSSWGSYTGGANGGSFAPNRPSPGDFEYSQAPTYENRYDDTIQDLISDLLDRPDFSYDPDTDPLYQNYRKQYAREGQRATADALGTTASASGGIPSSYAGTVANQTSNRYAAELTDKIPELYELAYNKYLNDYNMQLSDLGVVQGAEQSDYDKYLNQLNQFNTDRGFSYGQFLDEIDSQAKEREEALNNAILAGQYGDYSFLNGMGINTDNNPTVLQQQEALKSLAQAQVDGMLQTGTMPSTELLQQAGYSQEYANALSAYYKNQIAAQAAKGRSSGGRSSGGNSGSGKQDYDGLFAAALESGRPKSYIANNYKRFGFTSNSGLYDDYTAWNEEQGDSGMNEASFNAAMRSIAVQLQSGKAGSIVQGVDGIWPKLSPAQRVQLNSLLKKHGYEYTYEG